MFAPSSQVIDHSAEPVSARTAQQRPLPVRSNASPLTKTARRILRKPLRTRRRRESPDMLRPPLFAPYGAPATPRPLPRIAHALLELLSPTRCVGCERPGTLLCENCLSRIAWIDPASSCLACGAPFGAIVCTECRGAATPLTWCMAAAAFEDPVPRLIRAYKDHGEQRAAYVIAELLAAYYRAAQERAGERLAGCAPDAVTFVPVTAQAYRRRGFDHMEQVALITADKIGLPLVDALAKHGSADQRNFGRQGRLEQARGAYEVVARVDGRSLLLLDDVITTGATVNAAAGALLAQGASRVAALALARVW